MRVRASTVGVAIAVLLLSATPSWAEPSELDRVELGASESEVAAQRARWETRFADARTALVDAHLRHIDANNAYKKMRHRRNTRGEKKTVIMQELQAAESGLAEAGAAMNALLDSARRARVPRHWMPDDDMPAALDAAETR